VPFYYREHCYWTPSELVQEFVMEAQRAKAVLQASMKLWDSQHVPEALWRNIYNEESPKMAARREESRRRSKFYGPSTERNIKEYHVHWNSSPKQGIRFGWSLLIDLVNHYTVKPGGLASYLVYDGTEQGPQLRIASQLGFLPAVWSMIAQLISRVPQLYCCDGCGKLYQRTGRKPKEGQKNYCPDCGMEGGYKASKRQSKAQKQMQA
jgi:hypothetical protein